MGGRITVQNHKAIEIPSFHALGARVSSHDAFSWLIIEKGQFTLCRGAEAQGIAPQEQEELP